VKRFKRGREEFNAEGAESAEYAEKRMKEHSQEWLCHRDGEDGER
jgi:hypothetical protein